jgi:hypothetical protein
MNKTKKARKTSISLFGINDCHKPKNNTKKGYEYRIRKIYKRPKTLKNYGARHRVFPWVSFAVPSVYHTK